MSPWTVRICATVLSFAACAGCASTNQAERYRALRSDLARAQPAAPSPSERDALAGVQVLARSDLVSSVLERNPGISASRAAWQAALARYPQETAFADPMLSYGVRPRSFSSDRVDPAQEFELSQALPFFGKRALRGERALADADAAKNGLDAERVRLAALASTLFDEYWLAERSVESNEQHLALLDEAHQVALSRYGAGTGMQQDVLAAETEQAELVHRGVELRTERRIVSERINTLLRRAPELDLPPAPLVLEPIPVGTLDEPELVARARELRPELRALAAEVNAREADVAAARREFFPDFTVRAGYDTTWQESPLKTMVGIEFNVPLQLGRRRAALEEAEARLTRERSRATQLEDRVRFEVSSAVERIREAQHLLEITQQRRLPIARSRVAGAQASFATGQGSFLELVDAERALRDAELAAFEARANISVRQAALSRAVGTVASHEEERP